MTPPARRLASSLGPAAAGLAAALFLAGCGGDGLPTAPVAGTVTYDGQPVKGGSVTFAPIASGREEVGKPASGSVGDDGTFTLITYSDGDGAAVGKHRVSYSPPTPEAPAEPASGHALAPPPSPYAGMAVEPAEVEVKPGGDTFDHRLVKPVG